MLKRAALLLFLAPLTAAADDVRDFAPDRPSRSDSPITVPAGYYQIESDLLSYTNTGDILQGLDPLLKYGVTNHADIEVQIGGLISQRTDGAHSEGFGDVTVRAKISLLGDDGGAVSAALIPYVKIPTARPPIGNGQVEFGVNMPVLFTLPFDFGLTLEPEIAALKNAETNGKQASYAVVINLGRRIYGDLSGFVEIYNQHFTDPASGADNATFDFGLAYALSKTMQLDAGANVGLNHSTPHLNVYTGIATRF